MGYVEGREWSGVRTHLEVLVCEEVGRDLALLVPQGPIHVEDAVAQQTRHALVEPRTLGGQDRMVNRGKEGSGERKGVSISGGWDWGIVDVDQDKGSVGGLMRR